MINQKEIVINDDNKDKNKKYIISQMPAIKAEQWCYRALNGMIKAGVNVAPALLSMPSYGLTLLFSEFFKMNQDDLLPLLHELLEYVHFVVDKVKMQPGNSGNLNRKVSEHYINPSYIDIEEPYTFMILRKEVFDFNMGFLVNVANLILNSLEAYNK
jgi:hypothetical protein